MKLTKAKIKEYQQGWKVLEKEEIKDNLNCWEKAGKECKKITDLLISKFGAKKIVIIGSITDKNKFRKGSDIDIAVEGLSDEFYYKAVGTCQSLSEFSVDLIDIKNAGYLMKKRIALGKVVYEQE